MLIYTNDIVPNILFFHYTMIILKNQGPLFLLSLNKYKTIEISWIFLP